MRLIKPSHKILFISPKPLETIEAAGRVCYKSEDKITEGSAEKFVRMIMKRGHHSVIEHAYMSVRFICDRGVSHEIVRHRLANYSQESSRYCNYKGGVTFIVPPWVDIEEGDYSNINHLLKFHGHTPADVKWFYAIEHATESYCVLLSKGWSPQQARSVLPNSLKTEIIMTANLREWMHVFKLRTSKAAHPQMRELMIPLLEEMKTLVPVIFDNIENIIPKNIIKIPADVAWPGDETEEEKYE